MRNLRWIYLWAALMGIWILPAWGKATSYDLAGRWKGTVEVGKLKIRLVLNITKEEDGRVTSKMDVIDQGVRDFPLAALLFNDPEVRLEFDQLGAAFNGVLSEDHNEIKGTVDEGPGGIPIAVVFKRVSDKTEPEVPKVYTFQPGEKKDIRGYWMTTIEPSPGITLRLGLKIGRKGDGAFEALMDSLDQGARDIPASLLTVQDQKARVEWNGINLVFEAQLDVTGDKLSGSWKQGSKILNVTFNRLAKPPSLLPENLLLEPSANPGQELRGYWMGTLKLPNQDLRLAFKLGQTAEGEYAGTLASLDQGGIEVAIYSVAFTNGNVRLELKGIHAVYSGSLTNQGAAIEGKWEQGGNPLPLTLERTNAPAGAGELKAQKH